MPRVTELNGYAFAVIDTTVPEVDPKDGQIIHDALGQPKTVQAKQIVFFDQLGDQVKVALPDEARRQLVEMLTGVEIPTLQIAH